MNVCFRTRIVIRHQKPCRMTTI